MLRRRPLLLSLAIAAAALLLAACGSGGNGGGGSAGSTTSQGPTAQAKDAVDAAAAKTRRTSAHVDIQVVVTKPGASRRLIYGASGDVSPAGGRLEIDQRLIGGNLEHEVFARQNGHLVLYTTPTSMIVPKGKTWLKVDMTRFGKERYGADTTFLAGTDQDPVAALSLVASKVTLVSDLGPEWLPDDTLNTHYHGIVNVIAAARAAGVKGKGLTALQKDMGSPTQTIDVWVNKQGTVQRVQVQTPIKAADGTRLNEKSTADFSDWGVKTAVKLPPARKVADYFQVRTK